MVVGSIVLQISVVRFVVAAVVSATASDTAVVATADLAR